jgi:hypothetical protein
MGGSYADSYKFLNKAEKNANKFYGFLSTGSRQNANSNSKKARAIEREIGDIRDTYED